MCSLCSLRQPHPPAPACAQADLIDLGADRDLHYRYVLVYIDHYTRHVWLRPLPTKEPLQVAREVRFSHLANLHCNRPWQLAGIQQWSVHLQQEQCWRVAVQHMCVDSICVVAYLQIYWIWMDTQRPARLQSDNGTEFCAALMNSLCDLMGVEFVHGSVGHPQSQVGWEGTFAWYSACSAAASKLCMLDQLIATGDSLMLEANLPTHAVCSGCGGARQPDHQADHPRSAAGAAYRWQVGDWELGMGVAGCIQGVGMDAAACKVDCDIRIAAWF